MSQEIQAQRDYYTKTAANYDAMHIMPEDEHERALAAFFGLAEMSGEVTGVLDVGSGTGRGLRKMLKRWPSARVIGIEPVAALREMGHAAGVPQECLISGDALRLPFADSSFDFVIETGALHHIAQPLVAVGEMVRVAKRGVMISDNNHIGGGSNLARDLKYVAKSCGMMKPLVWLQTRGKMYRESEGDGIFYTFTAFDCIETLKAKFDFVHIMNTRPSVGFNPYRGASHVMIFASVS